MAALYLELGVWSKTYEIEMRQILFLKRIVDKEHDDPCLQVYKEMLRFKDEPIGQMIFLVCPELITHP